MGPHPSGLLVRLRSRHRAPAGRPRSGIGCPHERPCLARRQLGLARAGSRLGARACPAAPPPRLSDGPKPPLTRPLPDTDGSSPERGRGLVCPRGRDRDPHAESGDRRKLIGRVRGLRLEAPLSRSTLRARGRRDQRRASGPAIGRRGPRPLCRRRALGRAAVRAARPGRSLPDSDSDRRVDSPQSQCPGRGDRTPVQIRVSGPDPARVGVEAVPRGAPRRPARAGLRRRERQPAARRACRLLCPGGRRCARARGALRPRFLGRAPAPRSGDRGFSRQAEPAGVPTADRGSGNRRAGTGRGGPAADCRGAMRRWWSCRSAAEAPFS